VTIFELNYINFEPNYNIFEPKILII